MRFVPRLFAQLIVIADTPKRFAIPVSVSPARTVYVLRSPLPSAIEVSTAIGLRRVPSARNGPRICGSWVVSARAAAIASGSNRVRSCAAMLPVAP
jgi:hypothetical protein